MSDYSQLFPAISMYFLTISELFLAISRYFQVFPVIVRLFPAISPKLWYGTLNLCPGYGPKLWVLQPLAIQIWAHINIFTTSQYFPQ